MSEGVLPQDNKKTLAIANRKEAIKTAVMLSNAGDIILLAGKGHENYQEINGVKHAFNDYQELNNQLELLSNQ
jgi:UDP-N-acetylmuramoyl-L-alanyl-D-glutamate--2,6-diaminopimelate ligase